MFAGVYAQIPRCVERIGDESVKSGRCAEVLHHFGLGRWYDRVQNDEVLQRIPSSSQ